MRKVEAGALRVSDHALLRLLQRSGFDVESIRAAVEVSLDRAQRAAASIGSEEHLITASGMSFVVRGGVVTTVVEEPKVQRRFRALAERPAQ